MRLSFLAPIYRQPGPFTSVYLDTSRDAEDAEHRIELRWRRARDELATEGAPEQDLAALDELIPGLKGRGPSGHAVFTSAGTVLLAVELEEPPRRSTARFSQLPHVLPLVAQVPESVPHVLAVVDRTGAELTATGAGGDRVEQEVMGRTDPIRKVSAGGWAMKHIQQRAENTWEENAKLAARTITQLAGEVGAELILVAGEERARSELLRALGEPAAPEVVEVAGGGRAPGTDAEQFRAEVGKLLADRMAVRIALHAAAFREHIGRGERAADGLADTLAALRAAQAHTVLVNDDPTADGTVWIGSDPTALALTVTELHAIGVHEGTKERVDAAIVRAATGTDAELVLVSREELALRDGVGCLLRYS